MTPARRRRLVLVLTLVGGLGLATTLALRAFQENMLYFYSPTQVIEEGAHPLERAFRIGGLVAEGSLQREPGSLTLDFVVTDHAHDIPVRYTGVVPDLFREGQGVVARGRISSDGRFVADEIMARHDETYMSPEVQEALERGLGRTEGGAPEVLEYGGFE